MAGWTGLVRNLGEALTRLLRAEAAALESDLGRSFGALRGASVLLLAAAFVAFWTVGLVGVVVVLVLAIWLPAWAAALIALVLFAAAGGGLVLGARRRLAGFENPASTVRRRFDEHLDWWEARFEAMAASEAAAATPAGSLDDLDPLDELAAPADVAGAPPRQSAEGPEEEDVRG